MQLVKAPKYDLTRTFLVNVSFISHPTRGAFQPQKVEWSVCVTLLRPRQTTDRRDLYIFKALTTSVFAAATRSLCVRGPNGPDIYVSSSGVDCDHFRVQVALAHLLRRLGEAFQQRPRPPTGTPAGHRPAEAATGGDSGHRPRAR
jgi:hypothetical protein